MRVFVTGATGFIGTAVTRELIAHGHQVIGLARSDTAAAALRAAGAEPHRGSLRNLDSLRRGAAEADGVIHLAFTISPLQMPFGRTLRVFLGGAPTRIVPRAMAAIAKTDRAAIDALGTALQGSNRPLVTTFGTMGLAAAGVQAARPATEEDAPDPRSPGYSRSANETAVHAWAARGVRASIIRLAPSVHGDGDSGLVPQLIAAARKNGESIYIDEGINRWCGVDRQDAATLFRLALEQGVAGGCYHGVGDQGVAFKRIADIIARRLSVPIRSTSLAKARKSLSWFAPFVAVDNPASILLTQQQLGWHPTGTTLIEDIDRTAYFR